MVNEVWNARIQAIDNSMTGFKSQRTALKANLDAAIANNDVLGVLNSVAQLQVINDAIKALKDQKDFLTFISTDPAYANDLSKADTLYNNIIAAYQANGLSDNLYDDVAKLKKLLRV